MFDPSIGRWITEDPIELDGGDVNLYRAMRNNPTNRFTRADFAPTWYGLGQGTAPDRFVADRRLTGPDIGRVASFDFWQTRGDWNDIGAGTWSQPDRAGNGGSNMVKDASKYPFGAAHSWVEVAGVNTPGGVCNTPTTWENDPNPDKAMAGTLTATMDNFVSGNYKVTLTWDVKIHVECGSVGASVTVHVNNKGTWKQAAFYNLKGTNTGAQTIERHGGKYGTVVPIGSGNSTWLIRAVPVIAGQRTGKARVDITVGILAIDRS